jgi:hypothetical protein
MPSLLEKKALMQGLAVLRAFRERCLVATRKEERARIEMWVCNSCSEQSNQYLITRWSLCMAIWNYHRGKPLFYVWFSVLQGIKVKSGFPKLITSLRPGRLTISSISRARNVVQITGPHITLAPQQSVTGDTWKGIHIPWKEFRLAPSQFSATPLVWICWWPRICHKMLPSLQAGYVPITLSTGINLHWNWG